MKAHGTGSNFEMDPFKWCHFSMNVFEVCHKSCHSVHDLISFFSAFPGSEIDAKVSIYIPASFLLFIRRQSLTNFPMLLLNSRRSPGSPRCKILPP